MRTYPHIGVQIPTVYLPLQGIDLTRWAVVACDQFTSQPDYWQQVRQLVGDSPSTLNLILPEIYLGTPEEAPRIQSTRGFMQRYLDSNLLQPYEGLFYIERTVDGRTRRGLLLCLDLERYDFRKGSQTLIRATEGTILERLPPRIRIRENAPLELPHILVLIDDPQGTVIEPLATATAAGKLVQRYDFDLMLDSGHLTGFQVLDPAIEAQVIRALERLADPRAFAQKYALSPDQSPLLFAMGDGNHSLATAKAIWDRLKPQVGMDHPARYALVEVENVHDPALEFEPIHRLLFDLKTDLRPALQSFFGEGLACLPCASLAEMAERVRTEAHLGQTIGLAQQGAFAVFRIPNPASNIAVGSLQAFLDDFMAKGGAGKIDYIHGAEVLARLTLQKGNAGFFLPPMAKSDLFKTVILDGALPRKTFSMGEAREKRFYMESRRIQ